MSPVSLTSLSSFTNPRRNQARMAEPSFSTSLSANLSTFLAGGGPENSRRSSRLPQASTSPSRATFSLSLAVIRMLKIPCKTTPSLSPLPSASMVSPPVSPLMTLAPGVDKKLPGTSVPERSVFALKRNSSNWLLRCPVRRLAMLCLPTMLRMMLTSVDLPPPA